MTSFQNGGAPTTFHFNITGLLGHTHYCIQSIGRYRVMEGLSPLEGEVTVGQGRTTLTQGGWEQT